MSVGKSIRRSISVLFCCLVPNPASAQDATLASPPQLGQADAQPTAANLTFVRAFSSADDVRGPLHPVLDKTLDIIAGPKDPAPRVEALHSPSAVTTDSNDRIFVADPNAKTVHIFDFVHSKYGILEGGSDRLSSPLSLAVDGQDNLYVIDQGSRTILVYDSAGKFRRSLGKLSGGESYFESPAGIAIDLTTGHIYVCDTRRHMVVIMSDQGQLVGKVGKRGGGDQPGEFKLPTRVVAMAGELFVLDAGNARVQILDAAGRYRRSVNLAYADHRTGLAVDKQGRIYVSDPVLNQIKVFSHEGQPMYIFDPSTIKGANFSHPSGMWAQGGCLYVVDSRSNRVGLFQIGGVDGPQCR